STWWNGEASTWCYGDHAEYLHNDGVWRESTFNRKYDGISSEEKFTGYYKTQEAAMDAMTTWMSTSSDFPVDKTLLVVDKDT
ncbi:hypothetical protein, partial [Enterococcus faecium]|uniref:hypothetical protein n=1 Tax=Enterococcus faecium TaxID=1352 RepID=UPI003F432F85